MDAAELKARIRRAFAGVPPPPDWCLVNSHEGAEPALLAREFRGKTDWLTLEAAFIDRAPDGFGTALAFFSDEAFHFYLPAYLIADIDGLLRQADPVFALTHGLDNASRGVRINPRRYGERTWYEHARHRFSMFDAREAAAIADYLGYKLQGDALTEFQKAQVREALDNYWKR